MPVGYLYKMKGGASDGGNKKIQPRLSTLMHRYLDDLVATELYGSTPTEVAKSLIEAGVKKAIADRHINVRRRSGKGR